MPRLAKALAASSRTTLALGSTVVDWLTLGVLGAATVALAVTTLRPPSKTATPREAPRRGLFRKKA